VPAPAPYCCPLLQGACHLLVWWQGRVCCCGLTLGLSPSPPAGSSWWAMPCW
jgi:hypothetical protein